MVNGGQAKTIDIYQYGCYAAVKSLDVQGGAPPLYTPLKKARVKRKLSRSGTFEWRATWELPEFVGGGRIVLHHDETEEDKKSGFNRAENLRLFSEHGDKAEWNSLFGRRNDTESGNRIAKRHFPDKRARSIGPQGQLVDLIGHAFVQNAMARAEEMERSQSPLGTAAA
jgi:hypothetical protein